MREFWVASGHHLTRRADHGGLIATPELIMAYLARPELMPPADAVTVEAQQLAEHDLHASPLTAMLAPPKAFGEMDVMDDENAWTYWSRSDAHAMVMNIGGNPKARAGFCRVIERWIGHLLGVAAHVETVASIEDRDWRWFVGLDSEATRIGNAWWNGAALDDNAAERIVALMRLDIEDARLVDERVGNKPIYLILAMGADRVVRLKPQNLVAGLPIKHLEAAS